MYKPFNTLFTGKVCHKLSQVSSTNEYAKGLLSKTKPVEGTAIIAHHQQQGKGQYGNNWEAEAGKNLTASYIFFPKWLLTARQFQLNMAVSLAVRDAVQEFLPTENVLIKWPNDIYVSDKKLAGILIENSISGSYLSDSVIGVGINVDQERFSEQTKNAASIFTLGERLVGPEKIFEYLSSSIEQYYLQLKEGKQRALSDKYYHHLLGFQQSRMYLVNGEELTGIITEVDTSGRLVIQHPNKKTAYAFKEVGFII